LDGKPSHGVLYKPNNFDSTKKYPLIITIYEKLSHQKNIFHKPEFSPTINIPWEISRGYLILTVDVYYSKGSAGLSSLNAVLAALDTVQKLGYVDGKNIGLIGHSFGGFEINYLIAHTNKFKCAVSSSGISNILSQYLELTGVGSLLNYVETAQMRMGGSLWNAKNVFLENSAVINADKIETPLLMMANNNDAIVNFSQGIGLFQSLKRLGKPVWLLQYDNEAHLLLNENNNIDCLLRYNQFFDYYLKNTPPPAWLKNGIPSRLKGTMTGY
jgi:dipeptidyl aminopeptidase/acylaminoacyl peptidase